MYDSNEDLEPGVDQLLAATDTGTIARDVTTHRDSGALVLKTKDSTIDRLTPGPPYTLWVHKSCSLYGYTGFMPLGKPKEAR